MNLMRDAYYKRNKIQGTDYTIHNYTMIVEFYSEIQTELNCGGHTIKPLESQRDFMNREKPQRLSVKLKVALPDAQKGWIPRDYVDEISSNLSLVTGRITRSTSQFVYDPSKPKIYKDNNLGHAGHPQLTYPLPNGNIQEEMNILTEALFNVGTENGYKKHKAIIHALGLYRDSLILLPYDEDSAYVLLVAAGEAISSFSNIQPKFETDFANAKAILELTKKYNLSEEFTNELVPLISNSKHMKLKAKFIDVIFSNLDDEFWKPPQVFYPVLIGYDPEKNAGDRVEWHIDNADWPLNKENSAKAIGRAYDLRSRFVHEGVELPLYIKGNSGYLYVKHIRVNEKGEALRNKQGEHVYEDLVPSYFWMERAINRVLRNLIVNYGQTA